MFLKLTFIFLIGIAYAAQTRIKIGSKSWGFQIDLKQGHNCRTEFSNENGVTNGIYLFTNNNQTKKLEYKIDPNTREPDIYFNVINIEPSNKTLTNGTSLIPTSNVTFDSIDSDQDFRGHVTLKVGNSSYNINFSSGNKNNSREEILTPSGLLYGRFNFLTRNGQHKVVISYKFNSTAPDPTFEVSLFKSSDTEIYSPRERENLYDSRSFASTPAIYPSANFNRPPYQRVNQPYYQQHPSSATAPSTTSNYRSSSSNDPRDSGSQTVPGRVLPPYYTPNEKYRSSSSSHSSQNYPNWYNSRNKIYDN